MVHKTQKASGHEAPPVETGESTSLLPPRGRRMRRVALVLAMTLVSGIAAFALRLCTTGPRYEIVPIDLAEASAVNVNPLPRGIWLSIDTVGRKLRVYRGAELLREAACSTGSGVRLVDELGDREWVFDTPIGLRHVQRKARNPVWVKPDWAFVEEGRAPPPMGSRERYDDVSLGDFALYLGDGYMIHGTLFQSLVGQPVTHGCIRLGDEDLEYVYRTVPLGAPTYLY